MAFVDELASKLRAIGAFHAVGETWISFDSSIPAGGVPFCGQLVSRAVYADLWSWVQAQGKVKTESEWQSIAGSQNGNCSWYSDGDGETTFRMPAVLGYMRGVGDTTEAGQYKEQALPNVKGSGLWYENVPSTNAAYTQLTGAFYLNTDKKTYYGSGSSDTDNYCGAFDANRYDARYKDNADVTPETFTVIVGVYAVSVISNFGSADLADIQTSVANLDVKVNNIPISTSYVTESWVAEDGNSWYRKYSDGWIEQGGELKGVTGSVTFPISFSEPPKAIAFSQSNSASANVSRIAFKNNHPTNTGMTIYLQQTQMYQYGCFWIACGY